MWINYIKNRERLGFSCRKDKEAVQQISNFGKNLKDCFTYTVRKGNRIFIFLISKEFIILGLILFNCLDFESTYDSSSFLFSNSEVLQTRVISGSNFSTINEVFQVRGGSDDLIVEEDKKLVSVEKDQKLVRSILAKTPGNDSKEISINKMFQNILTFIDPVILDSRFHRLLLELQRPSQFHMIQLTTEKSSVSVDPLISRPKMPSLVQFENKQSPQKLVVKPIVNDFSLRLADHEKTLIQSGIVENDGEKLPQNSTKATRANSPIISIKNPNIKNNFIFVEGFHTNMAKQKQIISNPDQVCREVSYANLWYSPEKMNPIAKEREMLRMSTAMKKALIELQSNQLSIYNSLWNPVTGQIDLKKLDSTMVTVTNLRNTRKHIVKHSEDTFFKDHELQGIQLLSKSSQEMAEATAQIRRYVDDPNFERYIGWTMKTEKAFDSIFVVHSFVKEVRNRDYLPVIICFDKSTKLAILFKLEDLSYLTGFSLDQQQLASINSETKFISFQNPNSFRPGDIFKGVPVAERPSSYRPSNWVDTSGNLQDSLELMDSSVFTQLFPDKIVGLIEDEYRISEGELDQVREIAGRISNTINPTLSDDEKGLIKKFIEYRKKGDFRQNYQPKK